MTMQSSTTCRGVRCSASRTTARRAEPAVLGAYLGPGRADGTLALVLDPEGAPEDAARAVAGRLAADETLRARLVRGLDLALLPAGTNPPGEALYVKR